MNQRHAAAPEPIDGSRLTTALEAVADRIREPEERLRQLERRTPPATRPTHHVEINHGVEETGIRPGIIGEIGTGDPITNAELRALRAAACAVQVSELALRVRVQPWSRRGHKVIDVITAEELDPDRLLLNHVSTASGSSRSSSLTTSGCAPGSTATAAGTTATSSTTSCR